MRQLLLCLISLSVSVCLVACGNDDDDNIDVYRGTVIEVSPTSDEITIKVTNQPSNWKYGMPRTNDVINFHSSDQSEFSFKEKQRLLFKVLTVESGITFDWKICYWICKIKVIHLK